jgi:hypothetical protein
MADDNYPFLLIEVKEIDSNKKRKQSGYWNGEEQL